MITLGDLGNCVVDQECQIGALKDLQSLCICQEDPSGTKLLGIGGQSSECGEEKTGVLGVRGRKEES